MGSEWEEVPFNDLGEVNRGRSRHRPRYAEHLYGGDYPFIQTGDIRGANGRIVKHTQTYSEEGLAQSRLWPTGAMCITIAANIAETAILTYPACFPDSVVGFIADESKCDVRFIEYNFRLLKRRLQSEAIGSVQDNINLATLSRLNIPLPPLPEQKAIAHILGALDDKIELNRQINEMLEAMAQALFKSWFVDFDPVIDNALAAGNPIPDVFAERAKQRQALIKQRKTGVVGDKNQNNPAIQDAFPNAFEYTEEMGWIPEGWGGAELSDIAEHIKNNVKAEDIASDEMYVGLEHIGKKKIFLSDFGSGDKVTSNKSRFKKTNILFGKLRPYFHKVCIAPEDGICSTDILIFKPKKKNLHSFLSMVLFSDKLVEYANLRSTGTRMPRANVKDMLAYNVLNLPCEITDSFELLLAPIWVKGISATEENKTLTKLRDTLLPKLLSGELRIPDAEQLIEEAEANVSAQVNVKVDIK